jgi:hypothetical protein
MIDIYAATGTFPDTHKLAVDAAAIVREVEQVPDIPMFRQNTAAFVHEMPPRTFANLNGDGNYVRVQVLTNVGGRVALSGHHWTLFIGLKIRVSGRCPPQLSAIVFDYREPMSTLAN